MTLHKHMIKAGWSFGGYRSPAAPGAILRAMCADGRARSATVSAHADTYFSLPARVKVRGKTVSGFVWINETGEGQPLCFTPQGKNAGELPAWKGARS